MQRPGRMLVRGESRVSYHAIPCKDARMRRACCTAFFGATAGAVFFFWYWGRNFLGTSNVPNTECLAKTFSCDGSQAWAYAYE